MRSSHIDKSARELSQIFAPSLVPIMLGYVVAHYFSFIVFQGQALWPLLSDPLGNGADYFGTRGHADRLRFDVEQRRSGTSRSSRWSSGTSPDSPSRTTRRWPSGARPRAAVQSQLWMLVVMVGFTSLGLWLLSQANQ